MSIYEDIVQYIKSGETSNKKLGLEIEHFVVNEEGVQITFEQIVPLIEEVAKGIGAKPLYTDGYVVGYVSEEYVITLEPACQFEISINPYERIEDIKRVYKDFRDLWDKEFEQIGYLNFYLPRFNRLHDNRAFSVQHIYKQNAEGC